MRFIFVRCQVSICIGVSWNCSGLWITRAYPGGKPWNDLRYSPPLPPPNGRDDAMPPRRLGCLKTGIGRNVGFQAPISAR